MRYRVDVIQVLAAERVVISASQGLTLELKPWPSKLRLLD